MLFGFSRGPANKNTKKHQNIVTKAVFFLVGVFAIAGISTAFGGMATSQNQSPNINRNNKNLTKDYSMRLLSQSRNFKNNPGNGAQKAELKKLSQQRKAAMLQLIKEDPAAARRIALDEKTKAVVPKEEHGNIESHVVAEGNLEMAIIDGVDSRQGQAAHEEEYVIKTDNGKRVRLHFNDEGPSDKANQRVRVEGVQLEDEMAVGDSDDVQLSTSSRGTITYPETSKKVATILLNFTNDQAQPWTKAEISDAVYTGDYSVNSYFQEASFGKVEISSINQPSGDIYGWYTVPYTNEDCEANHRFWSDAAAMMAAQDGADLDAYDVVIYGWPKQSCVTSSGTSWAGKAILGGSKSWLNGTMKSVRTVGHELGHNFGAHHSSAYSCHDDSGTRVTISDSCTHIEYGDPFDIMGAVGNTRHFNNHQKNRLGFFSTSNIQTVNETGTYVLYPSGALNSGTQAIWIPREMSYDGGTVLNHYVVEYRQPFGIWDAFNIGDPVVNGVSVRISTLKPRLVDATPETSTFTDSAFGLNKTFYDASKEISITPVAMNNDSASVMISLGQEPCVKSNPLVSVSPVGQWGDPGEQLLYNVNVTNANSPECDATTYGLSHQIPEGFTQTSTASQVTLASGQSTNVTIAVTSSQATPSGYYELVQTVTDVTESAYFSSVLANYNVYSTADTTAPSVFIMYPDDGAKVARHVQISGSATDNVGVTYMEIYINGSLVAYAQNNVVEYRWHAGHKSVPKGSHNITVKAYDAAGNIGQSSVTVYK